jgi:hypothetical protein
MRALFEKGCACVIFNLEGQGQCGLATQLRQFAEPGKAGAPPSPFG